MARPSKLTTEITEQLAQILGAGNWVDTACDLVGISRVCFYDWIRRGERGHAHDISPVNYVAFAERIKAAIAQVEIDTVAEIRKAPNNWQAPAWWLERRHPDRWGTRAKQTNTNVNVDLSELSDEDLEKLSRGEEIDFAAIARKGRAGAKA